MLVWHRFCRLPCTSQKPFCGWNNFSLQYRLILETLFHLQIGFVTIFCKGVCTVRRHRLFIGSFCFLTALLDRLFTSDGSLALCRSVMFSALCAVPMMFTRFSFAWAIFVCHPVDSPQNRAVGSVLLSYGFAVPFCFIFSLSGRFHQVFRAWTPVRFAVFSIVDWIWVPAHTHMPMSLFLFLQREWNIFYLIPGVSCFTHGSDTKEAAKYNGISGSARISARSVKTFRRIFLTFSIFLGNSDHFFRLTSKQQR